MIFSAYLKKQTRILPFDNHRSLSNDRCNYVAIIAIENELYNSNSDDNFKKRLPQCRFQIRELTTVINYSANKTRVLKHAGKVDFRQNATPAQHLYTFTLKISRRRGSGSYYNTNPGNFAYANRFFCDFRGRDANASRIGRPAPS